MSKKKQANKGDKAAEVLKEAFKKLDLSDPKPKPLKKKDKQTLAKEIKSHVEDNMTEFNLVVFGVMLLLCFAVGNLEPL